MSDEIKHNNGPCSLCKGCEQDSDFDYCRACGFTNEPVKAKDANCPFCGSLDLADMSHIPGCGISCKDQNCAAFMANIPRDKWNRRATVSKETVEELTNYLHHSEHCKGFRSKGVCGCGLLRAIARYEEETKNNS